MNDGESRASDCKAAAAKIDREKRYALDDAIELAGRAGGAAKFDETVEIAVRLGVDPRQADQNVRGTVVLPHGTGKTRARRSSSPRARRRRRRRRPAPTSSAPRTSSKKIQEENWLDFDNAIATPDMMGPVGRLGKILGPRGLMPNPKVGTVTFDVAKAVREVKAGKVEFRVEKAGIVHVPIGKAAFGAEKLLDERARARGGARCGPSRRRRRATIFAEHRGRDDHGARGQVDPMPRARDGGGLSEEAT